VFGIAHDNNLHQAVVRRIRYFSYVVVGEIRFHSPCGSPERRVPWQDDESILFVLNRFKDKPRLAKQSRETQTSPTVESGQNGQKLTIENSWHEKRLGVFGERSSIVINSNQVNRTVAGDSAVQITT
jgi:hypothetical protein